MDPQAAPLSFLLLTELEVGRLGSNLVCDGRITPIETVEAGQIEEAGTG